MTKALFEHRHSAATERTGFFRIGPRQNQLLAALPDHEYERVLPHLEYIAMPVSAVLCESGATVSHAYFPTTSIVSLQQVLNSGASSEVAVVGRDGMIGIAAFTGSDAASNRATVHCAGMGYRLAADVVRDEFARGGAFRSMCLRHAQVRMAQIAQTAVCYRHHSVDQQVCRRLLMNLDRLMSAEIPVTHELMAATLGVRREAVTLATCRLQSEGLIASSRGRIVVIDRKKLEAHSCECYLALGKEVNRLLNLGAAHAMVA